MKKLLSHPNCPNCGAPVTAEKCPYCGSVFLDFAAIRDGAPSYVKFKIGNDYICARLVLDELSIEQRNERTTYRDDMGVVYGSILFGQSFEFRMAAHAVPFDDGHTIAIIKEENKK